MCSIPPAVLNNSYFQALVCTSSVNSTADVGYNVICPNPDIMGIGVRVTFYIQSCMNALLVVFSPTDSVPTTWAGALLTTALVVAAIVLKAQGQLTLYHATLVLNFATLSAISSLAVAPLLPIWRLTPGEYYQRELSRHALSHFHEVGDSPDRNVIASPFYINAQKKQLKAAQKRGRIVLALAILIQVALQWTWGIYLFVSPNYSQPECSGSTTLVMFLKSFNVSRINTYEPLSITPGSDPEREYDRNGAQYFVWASWILFNLMLTLFITIVLSVTSPSRSLPELHSDSTGTSGVSATPAGISTLYQMLVSSLWPLKMDIKRRLLGLFNFLIFLLWGAFIFSSERQLKANCVFNASGGENDFGGFGQITAFFVSLAPLWSLIVALYKYPALRRRLQRHAEHDRPPAASDAEVLQYRYHPPMPHEEDYLHGQHILSPMSMSSVGLYSVYDMQAPQDSDGGSTRSAGPSLPVPQIHRRSTHRREISF